MPAKQPTYRTSLDQDKIDSTYLRRDLFKEYRDAMDRRMSEVEDTLKWAFRLLIGAFLTVIVEGAVIAFSVMNRGG